MSDLWFRRFGSVTPGALRLVCFPYAGGSAGVFHRLAKATEPSIEVISVQYPGRQDRRREPVIRHLPELADRIAEAFDPVGWFADDGPVAYLGHSMGAIVAYEVARRSVVEPSALIASGRNAPSCSRNTTTHLLDDAGLLAEIERLGAVDRRLLDRPAVMRLLIPVLRGDYHAIETYRAETCPPLGCPVTTLSGSEDPMTTLDGVRAWRSHTKAACTQHVLPGGHFFIDSALVAFAAVVRAAVVNASGR